MELAEIFDMGLSWQQWLLIALMPLSPLLLYIVALLWFGFKSRQPLKQPCLNCGEYKLVTTGHAIWDGLQDGRRTGGIIRYAQCQQCGARFEKYDDMWRPSPPSPPAMKKRVERVPLASHIIVGIARAVRVVELKDGEILEVTPEPRQLEKQFAEIEIEVEEVMYPPNWQPKTTIRHYFSGGEFEVKHIRDECLGRKRIYLMKSLHSQTTEAEYQAIRGSGVGEVFVQGYGWDLADDMERKFQFDNLIEARIKREAEQAPETIR